MPEKNLRKCKKCGISKIRILQGYYPNRKNKCWVDDLNREWNGNLCPVCNQVRTKENKRKVKNAF